jgi:sulfate permease, SulP family
VVGEVPSGLPVPALPSVGHEDMRDLLPTALTLALVQFMTVASLGKIYGTRHGYRVDPNDELKAIGMANVVGSLFRSLPASGSLSRTAVNEQTGARSPLSNWMAAAVVGITLLLLMPLAEHIPMAVLAGIIVMAVIGFVHPEEVRFLFRAKRRDGYLAVFTFAVTLLLGIREGILLGIAASATALLYRLSRPHVAELGHLPGTRFFRDLDRQPGAVRLESLLLLRLDAGVTFLNAEFLRRFVLSKVDREERRVRAVILDGITINDLDTTAVEALEGVADALEDQGVELHLTGLIGPVRDVVRRSGLYEKLGKDRFHRSPHQAVKYILLEWDQADGMDRLDQYRDEVLQDEPSRGDEDLFGVRPEDVQEPG